MMLAPVSLYDPAALVIVLAGTMLASLARSGVKDMRVALRSALALIRPPFDEPANRAACARWARAIATRGVLGAEAAMPPDRDLARSLKTLLRTGSLAALHADHEAASARTQHERGRAVRVFEQAGDLAPVFGLVGTLFSMTQMAPATGADAAPVALGAIATAVLSSLYGVLVAHFACHPLAHAIARRTQAEHEARAALIEWLAGEVAEVVPGARALHLSSVREVA